MHHQEAYRCGWVYITIERTERPTIDLQILSKMKGKQKSKVPGVYFTVLKHDTLFLYENEEQTFCTHMVLLKGCGIDLFPHSLLLDELYIKFHPIRIMKKSSNNNDGQAKKGLLQGQEVIYLYAGSAMDKEDWFLSLRMAVSSSPERSIAQSTRLTESMFMERLARNVRGSHLDVPSQWFNTIIGRIFFNLFRSGDLERLFRIKFERKAASAPRPFFVGRINLENVNLGSSLPMISNGQLHSVGLDGEVLASVEIFYPGGFQLTISSDLKLEIPKLKPLIVPVAMSVQIRRFSGKAMLRIKAPPTDRIWIGFYSQPQLEIDVEPVVATTAITWTVIKTALLRHLNQEIAENLVLPNMDDLAIPPLVVGDLFGGEKPFELDYLPPSAIEEAKQLDLSAHGISSMASAIQSQLTPDLFNIPIQTSLTTSSRASKQCHSANALHNSQYDIAMEPVASVISSSSSTTQRSLQVASPGLLDGARHSDMLARERQRNLTSPETVSGSVNSSTIFSPPTPAVSLSVGPERRPGRSMLYSLRRSVSSLIGISVAGESDELVEFQDESPQFFEPEKVHIE